MDATVSLRAGAHKAVDQVLSKHILVGTIKQISHPKNYTMSGALQAYTSQLGQQWLHMVLASITPPSLHA